MTFKANAPASKACTPPTPPACRSVRARRSLSVPNFVTITTSIPGRSRTSTAYLPLPPMSFFGGEEQEVPVQLMKTILASVVAVTWSVALMAVQAQPPASPSVTIALGARQGRVVPMRQGFTHTGGGNIDVAQPAPDTVIVTMTGVAVAGAHPCKDSVANLQFDLIQEFDINFEKPDIKKAKLTLEGRVIG